MKTQTRIVRGLHQSRAVSLAAGFFLTLLGACDGYTVSPPPQGPGSPPQGPVVSSCNPDESARHWAQLICPAGMICVGDVQDSSVANVVPLAHGHRPDWSLDGLRIAFHRKASDAHPSGEIVVINADGTGETVIAAGLDPAWSPTGQRIAFRSSEGIALMNADGTGVRTLVTRASTTGNVVGAPYWSPDGQRIVFGDFGDYDFHQPRIYVVNTDGSDLRRVTTTDAGSWSPEAHPVWSPDGGRIAFNNDPGLATVNAAGGLPIRIASAVDYTAKPDWSPDGSAVAFTRKHDCVPSEIHRVGSEGGPAELLIAGGREPAWSPDGARLAFTSAGDMFPAVTRLASVYDAEIPDFAAALRRFVLFNDGTFELQYVSFRWGFFAYPGSYNRAGSRINFNFIHSSGAGRWTAAGTLDGTRLDVIFNLAMLLDDFENGVFVLNE
jgi:WD40-like Beta Propeller Repeat